MQAADSIRIAFAPAALDYVYRTLQRCPHAEVHALLVDIEAQVKQQQTQAAPVLHEVSNEAA